MKKLVLVGIGNLSQMLIEYLIRDKFCIEALAVDKAFINNDFYKSYKIISFEDLCKRNPNEIDVLVAIAHSKMNETRREKCEELTVLGFNLINYVSAKASTTGLSIQGRNNIIMDNVTIEPLTIIGNGNIFWPGCCVSHHVEVGNYCTFTSGSIIAGSVKIQDLSFFGIGSTVNQHLLIGKKTLIDAGANITKDTLPNSVYVSPRAIKLDKCSDSFF